MRHIGDAEAKLTVYEILTNFLKDLISKESTLEGIGEYMIFDPRSHAQIVFQRGPYDNILNENYIRL